VGSLNWTNEAERWLRDIHEYIAQDDPDAASKVLAGIYERAKCLEITLKSANDMVRQPGMSASCFTATTASHTWKREMGM